MILGTAGHIDHGKTSLVKALTGVDTDRLPEEKKRGITIDLGFAPLLLDGVGRIGVVDVPGHEAFVRTMLAGASGIDLGLLVVAADEGIMPQTREHLEILKLLKVPVPVVALTKSDLVEADWASLVGAEIGGLVRDQQGTEPAIVRVSVVTGEGVEDVRAALAIAFAGVAEKNGDDLFRMPVDRVFTIKGTGTVVSGTIWSGGVSAGNTLRVLPSGMEARVRRVESHGSTVDKAEAGTRCAIAISNVAVEEIQRGDVLVSGSEWNATTRFAARLELDPEFADIVRKGRLLHVHLGTASTTGRVRLPFGGGSPDANYAMITLKTQIVARTGDRFVLRSGSPAGTVGGGVVVDPFPARGSLKEAIREQADSGKLIQLLRLSGARGIPAGELPIRLGIPPQGCEALISQTPVIRSEHGTLYSEDAATKVESALLQQLIEEEGNDSLSRGVSLSQLRSSTGAPELFDLVVRRLGDRGELTVADGLIHRNGWAPSLDQATQKLADCLVHDICASGKEPPSVAELVRKRGSKVPAVLRFLQDRGRLAQVETDRYYDSVVAEDLIRVLRSSMKHGQLYSPGELRDVLGVSRKYLIPFLEYCDRLGVTERRSDGRMLRAHG